MKIVVDMSNQTQIIDIDSSFDLEWTQPNSNFTLGFHTCTSYPDLKYCVHMLNQTKVVEQTCI